MNDIRVADVTQLEPSINYLHHRVSALEREIKKIAICASVIFVLLAAVFAFLTYLTAYAFPIKAGLLVGIALVGLNLIAAAALPILIYRNLSLASTPPEHLNWYPS